MKYRSIIFLLCLSLWVQLTYAQQKPVAGKPIYLADPTIFFDKGNYYLYGTSGDQGFFVYRSTDLKNWTGPAGSKNGYALKKGDAFGTKGFWAPQVFKRGQTYYMAYTADEQIAIAQSNSPLGPFKQEVFKEISGNGKQIDPFLFTDGDGKNYLYHVRLDRGNRIFVAEMKADFSDIIPGTLKECISGSENWENTAKTDWPVTEGPTVLKKNNLYYLFYSANDFRNPDYAVGYATSKSPLGPWIKYSGNPIISKANIKKNGTGHGDFLIDAKGHFQYVFHVHYSDQKVSPRPTVMVAAKFVKGKDGKTVMQIDPETFSALAIQNGQ